LLVDVCWDVFADLEIFDEALQEGDEVLSSPNVSWNSFFE
jgi:hypothetical protein